MNTRVLRFLNSEIIFIYNQSMQDELDRVFCFFCTHLEEDENLIGSPIATIELYPYEQFRRDSYQRAEFKDIIIRRSSAQAFNLNGAKAYIDDMEIIDSRGTQTALVLKSNDKTIKAYLSANSHVQFVDFIRDLIIKHEERCGTLILHAAAAVDCDRNGVVIVGDKGAGKSTLLLDLVGRQGFNFLSGDKVFVQIKDKTVMLYGWPDFPHLGYGTLKGHPVLINKLRKEGYTVNSNMQDKLLFTSEILQYAFGYVVERHGIPLKNVIFPNVSVENSETSLESICSNHRKRELLRHFEFSCQNKFASYHDYLEMLAPKECQMELDKFEPFLDTFRYFSAAGSHPINSTTLSKLK